MSDKSEKMSVNEKLALFIHRYRFILLGFFAALVLAIIALLVVVGIQSSNKQQAAKILETAAAYYEDYQNASDDAAKKDAEAKVAVEVDKLVKKFPKELSAQRALLVQAKLFASKEDYTSASDSYKKAYSLSKKSYLAPLALAEAAGMAEDSGDIAKALECYVTMTSEYGKDVPGAARSFFNLGRLYEAQKDYAKASETFLKMQDLFSGDSWTNIGKSRIIAYKSQGLVP
jgi:predicted negative regulator of RcsB-dependent stress response